MLSREVLVVSGLVVAVLALMRNQARPKKKSELSVSSITFYPIKSCRGVSVTSARLDRMGVAWDRRFMVIGAESKTFLTQRQYPKMALVAPRFEDSQGKTWETTPENPDFLVVSAPNMPDLRIPLRGMDAKEGEKGDGEWFSGEAVDAKLWNDVISGQYVGAEADKWFSQYIGTEVRLVATWPGLKHKRSLPRTYDLAPTGSHIEAAFADGFPLLIANEASLMELNRRVDTPVEMDNFRPNIVIKGAAPFAEDFWRRISIEDNLGKPVVLEVVKHCSRCAIPNVDPATGERRADGEPTLTLRTFRGVRDGVYFGQNCLHLSNGTLSVGAPVEVLVRHSMDLPERVNSIRQHVILSRQPFED